LEVSTSRSGTLNKPLKSTSSSDCKSLHHKKLGGKSILSSDKGRGKVSGSTSRALERGSWMIGKGKNRPGKGGDKKYYKAGIIVRKGWSLFKERGKRTGGARGRIVEQCDKMQRLFNHQNRWRGD